MKSSLLVVYLSGWFAACLLCGCTAEPVINVAPEESRPVTLNFASPDLGPPVSLTRSGTDAEPEKLPVGATVRIAAYYLRKGADGTVQPASFDTSQPTYEATYEVQPDGTLSPCTVDADGKKTDGTAAELTVRGGTYDFYAVSPARSLQRSSENNDYQITDIQHKEDVMTSFRRNVTVSTGSSTVTLNTFTRKCALIVFHVAPSKENVLPFDKLYGTSLTLKKISTAGASLIAGENTGIPLTGGGEGAGSEVIFSTDDFKPVDSSKPDGLNKAKGVILPKNNAAFDVSLTVVRDNETATLSATIDKRITFDPGKRYIFTLEVKNNTSRLQLTVQNWIPVKFEDTTVGGPDGPRPDPDIDTGTGTTITVAQWDEIPWTGSGLVGNSPIVRIDERILNIYYEQMQTHKDASWLIFPPFDAKGVNTAASHGLTDIVLSDTDASSMTGSYRIQVQRRQLQNKVSYEGMMVHCENLTEDGYKDWRMPTMIELVAMWDKCRGNDKNAADGQSGSEKDAAETLGEPFIRAYYWSDSRYGGWGNYRSALVMNNGTFGYLSSGSYGFLAVRCVRDLNISGQLDKR